MSTEYFGKIEFMRETFRTSWSICLSGGDNLFPWSYSNFRGRASTSRSWKIKRNFRSPKDFPGMFCDEQAAKQASIFSYFSPQMSGRYWACLANREVPAHSNQRIHSFVSVRWNLSYTKSRRCRKAEARGILDLEGNYLDRWISQLDREVSLWILPALIDAFSAKSSLDQFVQSVKMANKIFGQPMLPIENPKESRIPRMVNNAWVNSRLLENVFNSRTGIYSQQTPAAFTETDSGDLLNISDIKSRSSV